MEIKSFDTILTQMCDDFDELISPRSISRSNTNIIYLMFKAMAKGYEIINNVCVVLSNKFNPANCSEEDLVSVASLVGTQRRSGSASGLKITITNTSDVPITLFAGDYVYEFDADTSFEFEVVEDKELASNESVSYIAMSQTVGKYHVTEQQSIEVTANWQVPSTLVFSCDDNANLQGNDPESILAFRKRVLNTYDRQNGIVELEEYIRNLPYIFDCVVRYNQTDEDVVFGGVTVPPMTCVIFFSGEAKNEIAEMVCDHIICPTVSTQDSIALRYVNSIFANGYYEVNIIPFKYLEYTVDIVYKANNEYINIYDVKNTVEAKLKSAMNKEQYTPYIKEDDIYTAIEEMGYTGLEVLAVNLKVNDTAVDYVDVPVSKIAELVSVNFAEG